MASRSLPCSLNSTLPQACWAAAATWALKAAAPMAVALLRSPMLTSTGDEYSCASRIRTESGFFSTYQGWALPPDGARMAAAAMASITVSPSSVVSEGSPVAARGAAPTAAAAGSWRWSSPSATSMRMRPGLQALAQPDAPDRLGDRRGAQDDVAGQLRPGGEGDADLDHRRRRLRRRRAARRGGGACAGSCPARPCLPAMPRPCRRSSRAGSAGRVRDRSARRRSGRGRWWPSAREVFSPWPLRARWPSCPANHIPRQRHPGRREIRRACRLVRPAVNTRTLRYGSSSAIRRAASDGLVLAEIEHGRRNPVEVGQLQGVEVGQPDLAAESLLPPGCGR